MESNFNLRKAAVQLEERIQQLQETKQRLFMGCTITLVSSLICNGIYYLHHPENYRFKSLILVGMTTNIGLFFYMIKFCNKKIEDMEKQKMDMLALVKHTENRIACYIHHDIQLTIYEYTDLKI
jgi:hypothetical protein